MRKTGTVVGLVASLGVSLVAAGCSSAPSQSSATSSATSSPTTVASSSVVAGGTMTVLIPSDPGNLDPLTTVTSVTRQLDFLAYDALLNLAPNGKLVSGLASSWSQQGKTFTFTIRKGVTCADGSAFTAATAAANLNFMSNPKNKSPLLGVFIPPDAKATANNATGQLKIQLKEPFPFLFENLTQVGLACSKGLAKASSMANATQGTGPFVLSSSVAGQSYDFTVRKGYDWGPGGATTAAKGLPAKIVVKVVSNSTTQANLLLQGEANLATVQGLPSKPLSAQKLYSQSNAVPLGELFMNQTAGHTLADPKLRQAVVSALDLTQLGQVLGQGLGTPATGLVTVTPKACPGSTVTGTLPAYSQSKAEALLSADGWTPGAGGIRTKGGKKLELHLIYATDTGGDPSSAFQLAAQELHKVGIGLQLQGETTTQLESAIFGTGSWDLVNVPLGVSTPNEAAPFVSGAVSPSGENFAHIANKTYDALSAKATLLPGTTGCTDWDNAEKALFRAADVVPFENAQEPTWAKNATFTMAAGLIIPTSLRLLKH